MGRAKVVSLCACCAAMFTAVMPISGAAPVDPNPDGVTTDLAAAVRRDLHIEMAEYLSRAATSQRLADFEKLARVAYPMVFAGVRMDGARALVSLSDGTGLDAATDAARKAGFEVVRVGSSTAALQQRRAAVRRWIDAQPPRTGPSTDDSEIPVTVAAPGEPFKGGQPYGIGFDATHYGNCSLGFNATDADGHDVAISAGHCDPNNLVDPAAKTTEPHKIYDYAADGLGDELGYFGTTEFGPHDYSILRFNPDQVARFRNNLVVAGPSEKPGPAPDAPTSPTPGGGSSSSGSSSSTKTEHLSSGSSLPAQGIGVETTAAAATIAIDGVASPVTGMPACKSGAITGYTCGTVDMVGQTFEEGGLPGTDRKVQVEGFFTVTTCSVQGDSGGSVLSGTKALGLVSGGTSKNHQCAANDILTSQPIDAVLAANPGLHLRTS
ncbi:S1 family peptidase [Nocardia sp. CDC153]|uniref:S1 family peptidase n=1 Tax=Nocardia sp. CDC153 TaxID=3112167 RepID=UPI002DB6CCE2|nr:S1 family peptidase [Nocardia sp. CDC153]MEC3953121.1 S1 family peptidase [Nocardia sp. CDC153]